MNWDYLVYLAGCVVVFLLLCWLEELVMAFFYNRSDKKRRRAYEAR